MYFTKFNASNKSILAVKGALKTERTFLMSQKYKYNHRGVNKNRETTELYKKIIKPQIWKHIQND